LEGIRKNKYELNNKKNNDFKLNHRHGKFHLITVLMSDHAVPTFPCGTTKILCPYLWWRNFENWECKCHTDDGGW